MARSKYKRPQCYIFKIQSARLRKAKWKLNLSLQEARENNELVALGNSQVLRWIDEINGTPDRAEESARIMSEIRAFRKKEASAANRNAIRKLYAELDQVQFYPDYLTVVFDKNSDYRRACKGFSVNGVNYKRLVGTAGGIKNATIVFVSEKVYSILYERIDNGRNHEVKLNAAKFEAYRALTCSHTIPVSLPKGIAVVHDCHTLLRENVIVVDDSCEGEPKVEYTKDYEIDNNACDGFGMILPSVARRWSEELGLGYVACGFNHRYAYSKGMLFTFDFVEFAEQVAHQDTITDVWGQEYNIHDIEMIIPESVLKLWMCYDSFEQYMSCCEKNHYQFGIPKMCPQELEDMHSLNYQFLASYTMTDDDIDELIAPTINMIDDVLDGDYRKAILYFKGTKLREDSKLVSMDRLSDFGPLDSLLIDKRMYDDPFIKSVLRGMIRKRITDAKIGVIDVHGNYSIVLGDPYALCQSMFGMEVTGLLKSDELYNQYWADDGAPEVVGFRAPMSAHNNIRKCKVADRPDVRYWYRYITTGTVINAFSSVPAAMNGMDFDGDLVFLTNNRVLLDNWRNEPTIFCVQKSAQKKVVTEEDLIESNIAGFGNEIGAITNRITSMYDVMSKYYPGMPEYDALQYRITSGQNYQQNAIDKIKGIVSKPMPRYWYDYHANKLPENPTEEDVLRRDFNLSIMVDRKPYFMRYVYPTLNKEYKTFIENTYLKCVMLFGMTPEELFDIPAPQRSDEQNDFVYYYQKKIPVTDFDCVINRICHKVEEHFDARLGAHEKNTKFDPAPIKSGVAYPYLKCNKIRKIFEDYKMDAKLFLARQLFERDDDRLEYASFAKRTFLERCSMVCSNFEQLTEMIIDVCYRQANGKAFVWELCKEQLVRNLLAHSNNTISFPCEDPDGDIEFGGKWYAMKQQEGVTLDDEEVYLE